jgi:hypothetical protein
MDTAPSWLQGYEAAGQDRLPAGFAEIVVGGDPGRYIEWVAGARLPVGHEPGANGFVSVSIAMLDGDTVTFPMAG